MVETLVLRGQSPGPRGVGGIRMEIDAGGLQRVPPGICLSATLSANAIGTTLGNGQWGLILMALLIGTSWTAGKARGLPSGFLFAVALLKPTFSFAFANGYLSKREWLPLGVAALLTAGAGTWAAWYVGTQPFAMIGQMLEQSARWEDFSYSIPDALIGLGLPRTPVIFGGLAVAGLLAWLLAARQPGDKLLAMTAAGVLARVFSYHQLYDNVLILFLLLAWIRAYFFHPRWLELSITMAILVSLWLPGRLTHLLAIQVGQVSLWCTALAWLAFAVKAESSGARWTGAIRDVPRRGTAGGRDQKLKG